MTRKHGSGDLRKRLVIKHIQAAIARELVAHCEVPTTLPARMADLLRELHARDISTAAITTGQARVAARA